MIHYSNVEPAIYYRSHHNQYILYIYVWIQDYIYGSTFLEFLDRLMNWGYEPQGYGADYEHDHADCHPGFSAKSYEKFIENLDRGGEEWAVELYGPGSLEQVETNGNWYLESFDTLFTLLQSNKSFEETMNENISVENGHKCQFIFEANFDGRFFKFMAVTDKETAEQACIDLGKYEEKKEEPKPKSKPESKESVRKPSLFDKLKKIIGLK